jgi:sialate O-acetylesterase
MYVALGVTAVARAEVKPHALFSNHMVLQQGRKVPVWGTANPGERVVVSFRGQEKSATAKDGRWIVWLDPLKAGGPDTMAIQGPNTITIEDVLVGEVWICSGQSNMQWSVAQSADPEETIAQAKNPNLRLFTVPRRGATTPQRDIIARWEECGPTTVASFSAVGYAFGRALERQLRVPVGLINTSFGGTPAEAWTSLPTLADVPRLQPILERDARAVRDFNPAKAEADYNRQLEQWQAEAEKAKQTGRKPARKPRPPQHPADRPQRPTVLYNGMIAPLIPYAIQGVIWYQGESNVGRAEEYQSLFAAMIQNWRQDWQQGDFPFLFVQLAPFLKIVHEPKESAWAELREAQRLTARTVPNTAIVIITDLGDEQDIHPKQKAPVGERLALAARAIAYGESITYCGPEFESMRVDGDKAIIRFKHVGGGLTTKSGTVPGFTIAGRDRRFHNANAEIRGQEVVVSSPAVKEPTAVRFGWADYPVVDLWNAAGLPASPFQSK